MPKATLTFNLPEERIEHADAVNGARWRGIVLDINEELRSKIKYGTDAKAVGVYDAFRKWMWELIKTSNLDPYEEG
jgi:hypothetical protein